MQSFFTYRWAFFYSVEIQFYVLTFPSVFICQLLSNPYIYVFICLHRMHFLVLNVPLKFYGVDFVHADFDIIIRPTLEGWCQGGIDKVLLKKLNTDNIRIVSSILGQSVALDHYGRKVCNPGLFVIYFGNLDAYLFHVDCF